MKTSRLDGILIVELKGGYTVAVDGSVEERTTLVCRDINSRAESAAFDLEDMIMAAVMEAGQKYQNNKSAPVKDDGDDFFTKDSPKPEEITDMADQLKMMVSSSTVTKVSDFVRVFEGVLAAGLVKTDTEAKVLPKSPIWQGMNRHDKAKLAFEYCAFFVNPLAQLSDPAKTEAESGEQGE